MDLEIATIAATLGIFEVKYKVRADAIAEWQERCYTVAHMAGVALTDSDAGGELVALASRSENWRQFPTNYQDAADYVFSNTQVVIDLTPANDYETSMLLRRAREPGSVLKTCPRESLTGKFSGVIGEGNNGEIHLSSLARCPSPNADIHDDDFNNIKRIAETITLAGWNEECGTLIFPDFPVEAQRGVQGLTAAEQGYLHFRTPNNRRCFFMAAFGTYQSRNEKIYGTPHCSSHSENVRATSVRYSTDISNIEFSDVEIRQVGWDRRPQGLDEMLSDENYINAKSHLLQPK